MHDSARLLAAAVDAVRVAMVVARQVQGDHRRLSREKSDRSPVTVADFSVQAIVARHLLRDLGEVVLVGEESTRDLRNDAKVLEATVETVRSVWPDADEAVVLAAIDRGTAESRQDGFWTLDPIDGTKGFLRGEQYAVSLAFVEGGRPIVGVLGCPNLPVKLYWAIAGEGAFEEGGARIHASEPRGDEITFCESVEESHSDQEANRRLVEAIGAKRVRSVRMDSQAKYAVVARGDADAYLRLPKGETYVEKIWDHAAGSLIASEAGCVVSDVHGAPLDFSTGRLMTKNRGVVVARSALHARLIAALS